MIRSTILSAAMFALAASPALATQTFSFDYRYDREAAKTDEGAREVYAELSSKIKRRCATRSTGSRLFDRVSQRTCFDNTMQASVTQIASPALQAVHEEHTAQRDKR